MPNFTGKWKYKVRGSLRSEHHTIVWVDPFDIGFSGEQQAVGHAAWEAMFENEKDEWGCDLGRPSATARIMRKLCDSEGAEQVKNTFINTIVFERVDTDDKTH